MSRMQMALPFWPTWTGQAMLEYCVLFHVGPVGLYLPASGLQDPWKTILVAVGKEHPPQMFRVGKKSPLRTLARAYSVFRDLPESTQWSVCCVPSMSTVDLSQPCEALPVMQRLALCKMESNVTVQAENKAGNSRV